MPSPRLPFRTASTDAAPIPDEEDHEADLPLTMTASVVLTSLPRDAHAALAAAGAFEKEKSNHPFSICHFFAFHQSCHSSGPRLLSKPALIYMCGHSNSTLQSRRLGAYLATTDLQDLGDAEI